MSEIEMTNLDVIETVETINTCSEEEDDYEFIIIEEVCEETQTDDSSEYVMLTHEEVDHLEDEFDESYKFDTDVIRV